MSSIEQDVTGLLREWSDGNRQALNELLPVIYDELRRVAQAPSAQHADEHQGPNVLIEPDILNITHLECR